MFITSFLMKLVPAFARPLKVIHADNLKQVQVGKLYSVDVTLLHPGQVRFSKRHALEKMEKFKEAGEIPHKLADAVPVILGPVGFVVVDGHHEIYASLLLHAKHYPIRVIEKREDLNTDAFWSWMESSRKALMINAEGVKKIPPKDFSKMEDDPYRYLAAKLALKVNMQKNGLRFKSSFLTHPFWVKLGKDIPFIEFLIGDAIRKSGIVFDNQTKVADVVPKLEENRQTMELPAILKNLHRPVWLLESLKVKKQLKYLRSKISPP